MAKVTRERAVKERRARKQEKKEERKARAAEEARIAESAGGTFPVQEVDELPPTDPEPSAS